MHLSAVLLQFLPLAAAFCPLYGPVFPAPKAPAKSPAVQAALSNLTSVLDAGIKDPKNPVTLADTISIHIYSTHSEKPLYEYHREGTGLNTTVGVKKVDSDSIWRIGSISKLVTVYLVLKEVGDAYWDVPVTKFLPELKRNLTSGNENAINIVNWEEVTLGSLAGQTSGIMKDLIYTPGTNPLYESPEKASQLGLPPLSYSERPLCWTLLSGYNCTRSQFLSALNTRQPVIRPDTQPLYANTPFLLLAYALETITGKSMLKILESLSSDLKLNVLTPEPQDPSKAVIPGILATTGFLPSIGEAWPYGGLFSTFNDLTKVGRSMMNSTFLAPKTTRAWFRPTSFTSDLRTAIGRPWEIYRVDTKSTRGIIDVYGKGGDWAPYSTHFDLVLDYNVGFIVGVGGLGDKRWILNLITDILLPALDEAAREEANAAYAGTYNVSTNGTNSTITISTEARKPGLGVEKFTSNGIDVLAALSQSSAEPISTENFRLLPTNLEHDLENGMKEVSWRTVTSTSYPNELKSPWRACPAWFNIDAPAYGFSSIDSMTFTLGTDGKVKKIRPKSWKQEYRRV